ncbi:MAG: tRNA-dihydrouridine synthase family protein [Synergistaceae bacterium]|jgi:tRNA-dihydrouridine synthase|nr:tRNA-dihydrouridine synthase family protein [Synergistaceae bacterium]
MSETGKIRVGGLTLDNELWLAPLAGVTAPPVRQFFSQLGAGLTHTEMISCMGLVRGNRRTGEMLRILPGEGPVVLQLFCGDADTMVKGGEAALEWSSALSSAAPSSIASLSRPSPRRFAALGINMACPMPKVTKSGAGAALLEAPETAFRMTRGLKALGYPVWLKIRQIRQINHSGKDAEETLRFVEGLIEAGGDNVCIHGRTPAQRYEGRGDRTAIAAAAARFPGKISASGDVYTVEDVLEYLHMGCVGVMLARGALANPYLFPQALHALGRKTRGSASPTMEQQVERLRALGNDARDVCGPRLAVVLLKRLAGGVLRGMPGAADLRRRLGETTNLEGLLEILRESSSA